MKYLIVGYGNIGHKRKAALGKNFIKTFDPNPQVDSDYRKLEEVPVNLFDTVIITTSQKPKYNLVKHFANKGKDLLVEKPLIINKQQYNVLSELVLKNKITLYTAYNHRFEPNIVKLYKYIKSGSLGKLYHARFVYSFGNIKERIGTWRETEFGVLEEIAPHLIDFAINWFGYKSSDFETLISRKVESNILDHWVFATKDKKILFETSSVTWKNVFSLDIYGEAGSVHLSGLRKWGGSQLIIRKRVLPSGIPKEKTYSDSGPDLTWKKDLANYKKYLKNKSNTLKHDLEISNALNSIISSSKILIK